MTFDDLYTRTEDAFGTGPDPILRDHVGEIDPAAPVLDIGAGQGRHALFLAREGLRVDAIDPSRVAAETIEARAGRERLPIRALRCGVEAFEPEAGGYGAVLLFGLIPILTWAQIDGLITRVAAWTAAGGLLFVTAFSTADPAFARHAREWRRIDRNSFADGEGGVRTYLEPGRILDLFAGWDAVHHREAMGPEHRHGNGPPERHAMVEAVLRRRSE